VNLLFCRWFWIFRVVPMWTEAAVHCREEATQDWTIL